MRLNDGVSTTGGRKRVFLVDQFPIIRLAVSEWLKETPDLTLCGEADTPASAVSAIGHLIPDVVVTEIMRQQDLGFIHGLRRHYSRLPIVVFPYRDEEWYAPRALQVGASGYLMKGVGKDALLGGIRPRNLRINGTQAKGYCQEDMIETVRRYVPKAEARALIDELKPVSEVTPPIEPTKGQQADSQPPNGEPPPKTG